MQAMLLKQYGATIELAHHVAMPEVGPHDVLIKNAASSINPLDWKLASGKLRWFMPLKFPAILGFDFCGEVVAIGNKVTHYNLGDYVFGLSKQRGGQCFAEYVVANENLIAHKPQTLSCLETATIPLAGLTAWQSLINIAQLKTHHKVLINGASGGVGYFAVQIALALGAQVTAVCSQKNFHLFENHSNLTLMDYQTQPIKDLAPASFDLIFDVVANIKPLKASTLLTDQGCYVTTMPNLSLAFTKMWLCFTQQQFHYVSVTASQSDLNHLVELITQGQLKPLICKIFTLADLQAGFELSKTARTTGKIAIKIVDMTK
jgi:NADPH:quinone reductase-like Zn-dependent oxidoreductase